MKFIFTMGMYQFLTIGLYLCYIFPLYSGFVKGTTIGERCRYDDDCFVEHSFCLRQEICECKENFIASEDYLYCLATIGAICSSKHDCSSLPNSDCIAENCICSRGYVPDPHNAACKKASSGYKDKCEFDAQCQEIMGDFAACTRGVCECFPNFHFAGKCIKTRGLGDFCHTSADCYVKDLNNRNVTDCVNGYCKCKRGYKQTSDGLCINLGISLIAEKLLIAMTIFVFVSNYF